MLSPLEPALSLLIYIFSGRIILEMALHSCFCSQSHMAYRKSCLLYRRSPAESHSISCYLPGPASPIILLGSIAVASRWQSPCLHPRILFSRILSSNSGHGFPIPNPHCTIFMAPPAQATISGEIHSFSSVPEKVTPGFPRLPTR